MSPLPPAGVRWCEGATRTTARHLGEERKEARPLSCHCRTGGAFETSCCYSASSFFIFSEHSRLSNPTPLQKEKRHRLNIFAKCTLSSNESSLSSPLPSSLQPHWLTPGGCLCSTNLACVTLFPFPVPSMLIIILEGFFLGGGSCSNKLLRLSISLSTPSSSSVTQVMTFPTTVITGREK